MALHGRSLPDEERTILARVAHSRTASTRDVARARRVWLASQGQRVPTIAAALHLRPQTVRRGRNRFRAHGFAGLADEFRAGRPAAYTPAPVAEGSATALTHPQALNWPFGRWTRDGLEADLNAQKGLPITRSRIDERLLAEGRRWRQQETWCGERVDPAFAENRGAGTRATRRRPRAVS